MTTSAALTAQQLLEDRGEEKLARMVDMMPGEDPRARPGQEQTGGAIIQFPRSDYYYDVRSPAMYTVMRNNPHCPWCGCVGGGHSVRCEYRRKVEAWT